MYGFSQVERSSWPPFQLSPNDQDKSLPNLMEKMDSSDDKDKSKGAINVEDVVVDDVAYRTR